MNSPTRARATTEHATKAPTITSRPKTAETGPIPMVIEGHEFRFPANSFERIQAMREETISCYRAIAAGKATSRDMAFIFGNVIPNAEAKTQGGGATEMPEQPAETEREIITILDAEDDPAPGGATHGYNLRLRRQNNPKAPIRGNNPAQPPSKRSSTRNPGIRPQAQRRYRRAPEGQLVGNFLSFSDAMEITNMSPEWLMGKYVQGLISFKGHFARTESPRLSCDSCAELGRTCKIISGSGDEYVTRRGCGMCIKSKSSCSLYRNER